MAAALFQAAAGVVATSRAPPLSASQPNQHALRPGLFVKFLPAMASSSPFLACSCRARELPWSGGNSESSEKNLRVNAVTEVAETAGAALRLDNDTPTRGTSSSAVAASQSRTFVGLSTEEELLNGIRYEAHAKSLPPRATAGMVELYYNYRDAVISSGVENGMEMAVQIMATVLDRIILQFEDPFTFASYHRRMMEPYDYYAFGQNYIRPLIDFRNSYMGNVELFDEMESYIKQGHNVLIFANHQTEADPAVMALLLEAKHPYLAENLTYVAGDRVVLDPFCKPFSMGRNLLCVYSKKHINDVPDFADMKQSANTRTLKEMITMLKKGGQLIWIAPSGGRDRPDPVTDEWIPAAFDALSVDNMRRMLSQKSPAGVAVPGHIYPMALLCHDIMPPPRSVEKELGERRMIGYTGVGLSVAPEVKFYDITAGATTKEEAREKFSQTLYHIVKEQYSVLRRAVNREGLMRSSFSVQLSQPWFRAQNDHQ